MIVNLKEQHCENFLQSLHKEQWQKVRLGEVAEINPKESLKKHCLYKKVSMDSLEPYTKKIYSFSIESFSGGAKFRNGDTLLARITPCLENGKTAFVDFLQDDEIAFGSTEFIVLRKKTGTSNQDFLYYLARSKHLREVAIQSMTGSSGRERVQIEVLRDFTFQLPPLAIQQKIAEILSSFDDKIDLLHRQNKTLESLALTLFRHYFIDNPKRDEWELGKLGDYVKIVYGKNLPTKNLLPQGYAVFGGNGKIGYFDQYLYDEPQVLISCRGEASGKVNISERKSFITNNSLVLERTKDKEITFEYLKYYCLSYNFDTFVSGSAQPQITIDGLHNAEFIKANQNDILKFSGIISNFENKIENNSKQIQNLRAMRDVLLKAIFA
ncbi:restriction endonuclease subunit S [uncultured Helicobacter sp.]|uniref:restriction endonuclease subunit S n=1 Tax=uncultured Helicobacter sp. TaxID=175537 RepID=UPI0026044BCA|nr:restriction endonuclease subunit S [uncultured Helicobacter sp.]